MEALAQDLARLQVQERPDGMSLLEVLGHDQSLTGTSVNVQQVSDVASISIGGQSRVVGGANCTINLQDQNTVVYLNKTSIAFDLWVHKTCRIDSAIDLFYPQQWMVGRLSGSCGQSDIYTHDKAIRSDKKKVERYSRGMLLNLEGPKRSCTISRTNDGPELGVNDINHAAQAAAHCGALDLNSDLSDRAVYFHSDLWTGVSDGDYRKYKCVIPISLLFRQFDRVENHAIYLSQGQRAQFVMQLNIASRCVFMEGNVPAVDLYYISNAHLIKVFTQVPEDIGQNVLRSFIPMQLIKATQQQGTLQDTQNFVFSVPRGEALQTLMFSAHWNGSTSANSVDAAVGNLFTAAVTPLKSAIGFHPALTVRQITINGVGGQSLVINGQALQWMLYGDYVTGNKYRSLYEGECFRHDSMWVGVLDLARYSMYDLFGAQLKDQPTVFQVTIQVDLEQPTLGKQAITAANRGNFTMYTFLETVQSCALENGVYRYL